MAKVLYLTYDGLSTGLAQSQILPYLFGLTECGHEIEIVSCEQGTVDEHTIRKLQAFGLKWHSVPYSMRLKPFHATYNLFRLKSLAGEVYQKGKHDLIHGRSQLATHIGLTIRNPNQTKLIYDMRGFWADERVEGGIWDTNRWLYKMAYQRYKAQEQKLLHQVDHIVVLTSAAKNYLTENGLTPHPVTVIPCCMDENKFDYRKYSDQDRKKVRAALNVPDDAFLWIYIGSLGTWYLTDEMIRFFQMFLINHPNAYLLFLTKDKDIAFERSAEIRSHCRILSVPSAEVPKYIHASDAGLFFIRPSFSKTGSSPIKLAELWAMGKQVITNGGYGDLDELWHKHQLEGLISEFTSENYQKAIETLVQTSNQTNFYHQIAIEEFSLSNGIEAYDHLYQTIKKH